MSAKAIIFNYFFKIFLILMSLPPMVRSFQARPFNFTVRLFPSFRVNLDVKHAF